MPIFYLRCNSCSSDKVFWCVSSRWNISTLKCPYPERCKGKLTCYNLLDLAAQEHNWKLIPISYDESSLSTRLIRDDGQEQELQQMPNKELSGKDAINTPWKDYYTNSRNNVYDISKIPGWGDYYTLLGEGYAYCFGLAWMWGLCVIADTLELFYDIMSLLAMPPVHHKKWLSDIIEERVSLRKNECKNMLGHGRKSLPKDDKNPYEYIRAFLEGIAICHYPENTYDLYGNNVDPAYMYRSRAARFVMSGKISTNYRGRMFGRNENLIPDDALPNPVPAIYYIPFVGNRLAYKEIIAIIIRVAEQVSGPRRPLFFAYLEAYQHGIAFTYKDEKVIIFNAENLKKNLPFRAYKKDELEAAAREVYEGLLIYATKKKEKGRNVNPEQPIYMGTTIYAAPPKNSREEVGLMTFKQILDNEMFMHYKKYYHTSKKDLSKIHFIGIRAYFAYLLDRKYHINGPLLCHICNAGNGANEKMVEILLANGADANKTDELGSSPIALACRWGNEKVVDLLLAIKPSINLEAPKYCGRFCTTAYRIADHYHHENIKRKLLRKGANRGIWTWTDDRRFFEKCRFPV